jgi:predicted DsbA family dithiol-disulfide isomerase
LAVESKFITSDMIETTEFPHLVQKYQVMGVPKTVINEDHFVVGALPEEKMLEEIMKAVQKVV